MRSILVQAGRDPGMTARLDAAMAIARAREGHVTLLIDTPIDRFVTTDPYGGTYVAREALDAALKDDDALAEALAQPPNMIDTTLERLALQAIERHQPDLVLLSADLGGAGFDSSHGGAHEGFGLTAEGEAVLGVFRVLEHLPGGFLAHGPEAEGAGFHERDAIPDAREEPLPEGGPPESA